MGETRECWGGGDGGGEKRFDFWGSASLPVEAGWRQIYTEVFEVKTGSLSSPIPDDKEPGSEEGRRGAFRCARRPRGKKRRNQAVNLKKKRGERERKE